MTLDRRAEERALPLPAYARWLADARRRGYTIKPALVSVALAWGRRPQIGYGVVIPTDADPRNLAWWWISRLDTIIVDRGSTSSRVVAAIEAIERGRPRRLLVLNTRDPSVVSLISPDEIIRDAEAAA